MKNNYDNLVACGRHVLEEDQVLSILAGLESKLEPTLAVLTSTKDLFVQMASALLLASENITLQQITIL